MWRKLPCVPLHTGKWTKVGSTVLMGEFSDPKPSDKIAAFDFVRIRGPAVRPIGMRARCLFRCLGGPRVRSSILDRALLMHAPSLT